VPAFLGVWGHYVISNEASSSIGHSSQYTLSHSNILQSLSTLFSCAPNHYFSNSHTQFLTHHITMSDKLMDTEPGGEQTQYEGIHTFVDPPTKQTGQLGGTSFLSLSKFHSISPAPPKTLAN
jgi:hypothetical protein